MERDQGGANKDWNNDIEPNLSENDCDKGYDSKNPDNESLVEGEAKDNEGFGAREEEEEPGDEDEEEDDKGERVVEEREKIENVLDREKMRQGAEREWHIYRGE